MDDILLNTGGVVYYIDGWLMNQLTKTKQK